MSESKGIDALIQAMIDNEDEFRQAILDKIRADLPPAKRALIEGDVAAVLPVLLPAVFRALLTGEGLDEEDITPVRQAAERWATRGVTLRTVGEVALACAEAAIMMTRVLAKRSDLHAGADLAVMVSFGRGVIISQEAMTALFAGHARGMLNRRLAFRRPADPAVAPLRPVGGATAAGRPGPTGRDRRVNGLAPVAGRADDEAPVAAAAVTPVRAAGSTPVTATVGEGGDDSWDGELRQPGADILRMVAEGRTNVEIAGALHLSRQAVNYHVGRLMRALGASNRTALVARAYQRGLLLLTG